MLCSILLIYLLKESINNDYIEGIDNAVSLVSAWYSMKAEIGFYINILLFIIISAVLYLLITLKSILLSKSFRKFIKDNYIVIKGIVIMPLFYFILSYIIVNVIYMFLNIYICSSYSLNILWNILRNQFSIDFITLSKYIAVFLLFIKFSMKNVIRLGKIINSIKSMESLEIYDIYSDNKDDYIGRLSKNINNIVSRFKNLREDEKRAQTTKNELITNVSHDLRTPLTSILGYLSLVDEDKYKDEIELRYYINIAYEKAKRLNLLINDLFELTKMNNNYVKLKISDINICELLGQITAQSEYIVKKNNMEIRFKMCKTKMIIEGDGNKLFRVFENLISNSIKYGSEGKYLDVVLEKEENMALIKIINYGEKILSSDLPYIFDRLYRIEKSRNSGIGGSGLGLSISKSIVTLHKGKIRALSDNEKTAFEVRLPLKSK